MENNINLTPDAVKAIHALQHPCGTYQFYRSLLDRLFNYILNNFDEIGMSDNEAMNTLRALNDLRADIADIAGPSAQLNEPVAPCDSITLTESTGQLDTEDNESPAPEEVAAAFKEASESIIKARYAIFRLLGLSDVAESVKEIRELPEYIERVYVKMSEIRKQGTASDDSTQITRS